MAQPIPLARGQELKSCNVPTLVIQAVDDPLNPSPHGRHIADLYGRASVVEIANLGHALPQTHFNEILSVIPKAPGNGERMKTPIACYVSFFQKVLTSQSTPRLNSTKLPGY